MTIGFSLTVIVGVLIVTVLASLLSPKGKALATIQRVQSLSEKYLNLPADAPEAERAEIQSKLDAEVAKSREIPQKYRDELIESENEYQDLVRRARTAHAERSA